MRTIGIDPGVHGAVAVYEDGRLVNVCDMPVFSLSKGGRGRGVVNGNELHDFLAFHDRPHTHAWVEEAQAMPRQGIASAFNYGYGFGVILGVLSSLTIPYTLVRPSVWKRALGVQADKDAARYDATRLMPEGAGFWARAKDDGRAEAALIAYYGATR